MGQQIVKQPDGRFAIVSSETDTIIAWNAAPSDVVDWFAERAADRARVTAARQLGHVDGGRPEEAYHQFVVTWDEALEADREHGGQAWREFT